MAPSVTSSTAQSSENPLWLTMFPDWCPAGRSPLLLAGKLDDVSTLSELPYVSQHFVCQPVRMCLGMHRRSGHDVPLCMQLNETFAGDEQLIC